MEIPLKLTGLGIEREDAIGVQIVAAAVVAVILGARIAGGPVDGVEFAIVGAGEPRGRAAVLDVYRNGIAIVNRWLDKTNGGNK